MAIDVSAARDLAFEVIDVSDGRWTAFASTAQPSLFQAPRWCRLVAEHYGFRACVLAVMREGGIVGGLPFAVIEDFRGLRHVTFPFSDYCEPLGDLPWQAYEEHIIASAIPWTIRGRIDPVSSDYGKPAGMCLELALPGSMEEAEQKFHQKQRVNARRLERAGAGCRRVEDARVLDDFYPLYSILRKEKFRLLPQGRSFFEAVTAEYLPERGFALVAELDGVTAAAGIFLREGDVLYIKYSATNQALLEQRASNYFFKEGIAAAIGTGCGRFDLGASRHEGIIRFKEHLGANSSPFYEFRYNQREPTEPEKSLEATFGRLTQILTAEAVPLEAAQEAGDVLYRYFA